MFDDVITDIKTSVLLLSDNRDFYRYVYGDYNTAVSIVWLLAFRDILRVAMGLVLRTLFALSAIAVTSGLSSAQT